MNENNLCSINEPYKGSGQLTREQFLFHETRTTAGLLLKGMDDQAIIEQIYCDNLFQYPTKKSLRRVARGCLVRIHGLKDVSLARALAEENVGTAKQVCLYSMMIQYRLMWDFMITVIGAKYRQQDFTYSRRDINLFFMRLREQSNIVASWSESTVRRIGSLLSKILVENGYIDNGKAEALNPVLISPILEKAIRESGQEIALPAFNCLS